MKPRSVGTLWIGSPLSAYEELCLRSFANAGYEVTLYLYDPSIAAPEGVTVADANSIVPEKHMFENPDLPGSYALFANAFRYRMMAMTGFTWVDTDVVLLADALPDTEFLYAWEDERRINNAILRVPRESNLLKDLVHQSSALADPARREVPWGTYGPTLLTRLVVSQSLERFALPPEALYPIGFIDRWRLFDPASREWGEDRCREASVLHLWNSALQSAGVKHLAPPPGSYLHELMLRHEVELPVTSISGSWVRRERRKSRRRTVERRLKPILRIWRRARSRVLTVAHRSLIRPYRRLFRGGPG